MNEPNELGTAARIPMREAFDVMCDELDSIVNRMCGIDETAQARAWLRSILADQTDTANVAARSNIVQLFNPRETA